MNHWQHIVAIYCTIMSDLKSCHLNLNQNSSLGHDHGHMAFFFWLHEVFRGSIVHFMDFWGGICIRIQEPNVGSFLRGSLNREWL